MTRWMLMLLALLPALARAEAPMTLDEWLSCVHATVPSALRAQDVELETRTADGELVERLMGTLYAQRVESEGAPRVRATLQVERPEYLSGAAYLVIQSQDFLQDGVYVYLPSVRRVRQVTGTFADGALLGTSFSYYDFKPLAGAFGGSALESEGTDVIEQRPVRVLSFRPTDADRTDYTRVRAWVDQATCLPLRMEFFEGDRVRKRLTASASALREADGQAYLSAATMEDLRDRRVTTFRSLEVQTGLPLSATLFDPQRFYRPR